MYLAWFFNLHNILLTVATISSYFFISYLKTLFTYWHQIPSDSIFIKLLAVLAKLLIKPHTIISPNISETDLELINNSSIIVVSNHQTGSDPILLMVALNKPLSFLATDYYNYVPGVKNLFAQAKCISVPYRDDVKRDSSQREFIIKQAVDLLNNNSSVALFPYGVFHNYRSEYLKDKKIKIKTGAAEIALRSQRPVVVVNLSGIPEFAFSNVLSGILYYMIFGIGTAIAIIEKVIVPNEFPHTGDQLQDIVLLSNKIKNYISTEYHEDPRTGYRIEIEELVLSPVNDIQKLELFDARQYVQKKPAVTYCYRRVKADDATSKLEICPDPIQTLVDLSHGKP